MSDDDRLRQLDAATGALVKDLRYLLDWLVCLIAILVILGGLQTWDALQDHDWIGAVIHMALTAILASAWWDTIKRASKYRVPR